MAQKNVNLLDWNPRGLNDKVRRAAVRDLVRDTHATIVCLQETKLDMVDNAIISETLGPNFTANYAVLPATGTRGGMILAVSDSYFSLSNLHVTAATLSATVTMLSEGASWTITCVYGPQGEPEKLEFIEELRGLKTMALDAWLIVGDFNLITKASDKNNLNINRRLIGKFRSARDFLQLKDMRMDGRRFTWSNAQADPVLTRIDHVFFSDEWDLLFPDAHLQAITSACSDHAPLFMQGSVANTRKPSFKFEEFWLRMPGFKDTVSVAWNKHIQATDPIRRFHTKLSRTAKALKQWQRQSVGDIRKQLAVGKEIILRLDLAEEARPLSEEERGLRRTLKASYLGLLAIDKMKLRQRSRLTWIRLGDANSKLFHARANGRRRRIYIQRLVTGAGMAVTTKDKEEVLFQHFSSHLGTTVPRHLSLDWTALGYVPHDLSELEAPFGESEIKEAVFSLPSVKAPGPDGFIGAFYKSCWEIIKGDTIAAITHMSLHCGGCTSLVNSANIVLLPKKEDATAVGDYRPISLIHSLSKIFSKLLANRLAPFLTTLVSKCQSAFVKKRSIHDNFLHVQNLIKELHSSKTPSLFLKLDISKAFDSVGWAYLLEVLTAIGFGPRWREWICLSLASATSRVLLNGDPGTPFTHARGLRQGDPLSPMLFILAIDPLQRILSLATDHGILSPIKSRTARCRVSLYADDAGIFSNPVKEELHAMSAILDCFGKASGLITNMAKTEIFPIRCDAIDLPDILSDFPAKIGTFPGKYLGLPLHYRRLRKIDIQPLIDKTAAKLPGWIGKNLARPGRVTLAKTVLMAMSTYHATVIPMSKWARDKFARIARNFVWAGDEGEHATGGHALVNWKTVCRPKEWGGLGMPDLEKSGRALRLRWPWLQWKDSGRPWHGSTLPCDDTDMDLFRASTRITLGNGEKASFWKDNWCGNGPLRLWTPDLFKIATRKNRSVAKEMQDDNWIRSIARLSTPVQLTQFIEIWDMVTATNLTPDLPDDISWTLTSDGVYSTSSAYNAQFHGSFPKFGADKIWSAQAEPKCKLFAWLAIHGKLLTADMLAIRGWPHDPSCQLCLGAPETAIHLCKDCPFSTAVGNLVNSWDGINTQAQGPSFTSISEWWDDMISGKPKKIQKRTSGHLLYVLWNVWKERNRRIFTGKRMTFVEVATLAWEDILQRGRAFAAYTPAPPPDPD